MLTIINNIISINWHNSFFSSVEMSLPPNQNEKDQVKVVWQNFYVLNFVCKMNHWRSEYSSRKK